MIITILEATVEADAEERLRAAYLDGADRLPPAILETFLTRSTDVPRLWRIFTVWRSREELEEYRRSVDTPGGVLVFRAAGAEPTLGWFEVVEGIGPG
jgi:quinol monooxygenase YgiN